MRPFGLIRVSLLWDQNGQASDPQWEPIVFLLCWSKCCNSWGQRFRIPISQKAQHLSFPRCYHLARDSGICYCSHPSKPVHKKILSFSILYSNGRIGTYSQDYVRSRTSFKRTSVSLGLYSPMLMRYFLGDPLHFLCNLAQGYYKTCLQRPKLENPAKRTKERTAAKFPKCSVLRVTRIAT